MKDKRRIHLGRSLAACGTDVAGIERLKRKQDKHLITCLKCLRILKRLRKMTTLFGNIQSHEDRFESFWAQGAFRKLGKTEARRHLRATVKTEQDWQNLYMAHEAYKVDLRFHPRPLLHGSTFCNQWRDFLELYRAASKRESSVAGVLESDMELKRQELLNERAELIHRDLKRQALTLGRLRVPDISEIKKRLEQE